MSAPRPRPVTATVNRSKPKESYRPRKNVSLHSSSSGSTESLISCINDISASIDSYQGRNNRENVRNQNSNGMMEPSDAASDSESKAISSSSKKQSNSESTILTKSTSNRAAELGAWEKWMIQKTAQMRQLQAQKAKLEKLRKEQKDLEELQKKEREDKAEQKRQEWLMQKNEEFEKAERRRHLREKRKKREEEEKKREIERKSQEKYNEWTQQKRKTEALRHALELEQQKLKEMELKQKKERSDMAFQAWLEKASSRTKLTHHTYAKCDGMLTGYYNTAASPSPSYYNPIPWQPVAVPPSMKEKPRKSRRRAPKNAWTINN